MNVDEVKQTPREGDQQCRPPSQSYRGGFGGRGSRGRGTFRGRFNSGTHRKLFCVFCGEDKGHTTRFCEYTKQKQEELRTKNSEPKLKEVANIPQYCPVNYGIPNVHALSYSYQQPRPAQQQLPPTPTFQALPPPPTYQPLPPPPLEQLKIEDTAMQQSVNNVVPATSHIFPIMGGSAQEPETKRQKKNTFEECSTSEFKGPSVNPDGPTYQSPFPKRTCA